MKRAILLLLLIPLFSNAQIKSTVSLKKTLEKRLVKAKKLFAEGNNEKALKNWKKVEKKANIHSATYGKAIRQLLHYYSFQNNSKILESYYKKAFAFNLNYREKKDDVGKSFLNFKYHSTIKMARYFLQREQYDKALYYIEKADNSITYHTNSITIFSNNKIDLAIWKYRILKAQEKNDLAISKLVKRAFEYKYKSLKKDWEQQSNGNREKRLATLLFEEYDNLNILKNDLDKAIDSCQVSESEILIQFANTNIKITIPEALNISMAKEYLHNSPLYKVLSNQAQNSVVKN